MEKYLFTTKEDTISFVHKSRRQIDL